MGKLEDFLELLTILYLVCCYSAINQKPNLMKYFALFISLLASLILHAQLPQLDSLKNAVSETKNDTSKIDIYYQINRQYYNGNIDSALKYAEKGLELSSQLDLPGKMVHGYFIASSAHFALGNMATSDSLAELCLQAAFRTKDKANIMKSYYKLALNANRQNMEEALDYYKKSLEIAEETGEKRWQGYILRDIGLYYSFRAMYDRQLENSFKAEELFKQLGDSVYLIHIYCDIAEVHRLQSNFNIALDYSQKAYGISAKLKSPYMNARVLGTMASTYTSMGDQENALNKNLEAFEIYQNLGSHFYVATTSFDIGTAYLNLEKYKDAQAYFQRSYEIFKKIGNEASMAQSLLGLGKINTIEGRYIIAEESFIEAEKLSVKHTVMPQIKDAYEGLANLYAVEGNYKKSNEYLNKLLSVKDSIYNEQKSEQINRLESEYQLKEKEARLELQDTQLDLQESQLQRQRNLNLAIGITAGLLFLIAILASINIRKRKRLNQQLKNLDKTKSRFFSNISHEMRNPLTLVMSPLQKLSEQTKNTPFQNDLQLAYSNSKKLLERVNEILDLSKLEAGKMEVIESPIVLYDFSKRVFYAYQSIAQYHRIDLDFEYTLKEDLAVLIDVGKIEKIINNLLLNAFKHAETKGAIKFVVERKDRWLVFQVLDKGKGIHPNDLPHIFDRYYQAKWHNDPIQGGSGIGLTLGREYARVCGGDLTLKSALGKGSTFSLHIPFKETNLRLPSKKKEVTVVTKEQNGQLPRKSSKLRILVVEDGLEMSKYIINSLNQFTCVPASDGRQAISMLEKGHFNLIVSDVMMPNMDGFTFREKVREDKRWKYIPFILLTARSMEEDKLRGLQLGVDDYITKPFNIKELLVRITNLLHKKEVRDKWILENRENDDSTILSAEEQLLKKAENYVMEQLDSPELNVASLASTLGYSQRQLERLMKKYCGLTPSAFIREIRLQKAYRIIEKRQFSTIKEVCYHVGMDNPASFSTSFKKRFGKTPGEVES